MRGRELSFESAFLGVLGVLYVQFSAESLLEDLQQIVC
jgi:hypothetical protein